MMAECFRCKTMVSETVLECPQCLAKLRCGCCGLRYTTQKEADDHAATCVAPPAAAPLPAADSDTRLSELLGRLRARWADRLLQIPWGRLFGHAYFRLGAVAALLIGFIMLISTCSGPSRKFSGTWNLQSHIPGHQAKLIIQANKTIQLVEIGSGMAGQYYTDETLKWYSLNGQNNPTIGFKPTSAATLDITLSFLNGQKWGEIFEQTGVRPDFDDVFPSEIHLELIGDGDQLLLFAVYGTAKSNQPLIFDPTRPATD